MDHGHDLGLLAITAALGSVLDDAVVLASGLDSDTALVDVVAARLFHVDVLAGLAGPDGHQRMPVVRRGDGHNVDVLVFEDLTNVLFGFGLLASLAFDLLDPVGEGARIGIDEANDLDTGHADELAEMTAAATIEARDSDADGFVGAQHLTRGLGAGNGNRGSGGERGLKELATACPWHGASPAAVWSGLASQYPVISDAWPHRNDRAARIAENALPLRQRARYKPAACHHVRRGQEGSPMKRGIWINYAVGAILCGAALWVAERAEAQA